MVNGFGYVWQEQKLTKFVQMFILRLKDQYYQEWLASISNSSKLLSYRNLMTNFEHEEYLNILTIRKFRSALAKLRISNHDLNIERGRYRNVPRDDRLCELCQESLIESEYHFVQVCKAYSLLRAQYLPRKYWVSQNYNIFNIIMSSKLKKLAYLFIMLSSIELSYCNNYYNICIKTTSLIVYSVYFVNLHKIVLMFNIV